MGNISLNLSFEILYLQSTSLSVVVCFSLFVGDALVSTLHLQETIPNHLYQQCWLGVKLGSTAPVSMFNSKPLQAMVWILKSSH